MIRKFKKKCIFAALKKGKDNDVVVAGVQSLGFNNKGYSSRMFGYVNKKQVFMTDYERKSLKYEEFKGYAKISGSGVDTKVIGYGQENNSGNPQGDHLSCVYRVECVDYYDGKIYTGGWGEREYSETPVGYRKQYLVRRCPRVWKNGAEYCVPYENKTGAVWNLYKFTSSGKRTFYSGHLGSVGLTWYGDSNSDKFDNSTYPGVVSEAGVYDTSRIYERQKWYTALHYVRAYLVKQTSGRYTLYETHSYNPNTGSTNWKRKPIEILNTSKGALTSTKKCYYAVYARVDNTLEIFAQQDLSFKFHIVSFENEERKPSTLKFLRSGILCSLPPSFNPDNLKIAAVDDI